MSTSEPAELPEAGKRRSSRRIRSLACVLLLILVWILTPLSVVAVWARSQVSDTDRFVATMAPLANDPVVQDAVADRVTDLVVQRLNIPALVDQAEQAVTKVGAPSRAVSALSGLLIGPATQYLTSFVHSAARQVVTSDAFTTIWTNANRAAHSAAVGLLSGDTAASVQLQGDNVVLDLGPTIEQVKQRLVDEGLGVASRIPAVDAQFTLLTSPDVHKAQTGYRWLNRIGDWLPLISVLMAIGAVLLAVRRRRALVAVAVGAAVGMLSLGIGLAVTRNVYLKHLTAGTSHPAAEAIFDQLVVYLRLTLRAVGVLGLVVALGAYLAGSGRYAVAIRGRLRGGIAWMREQGGFSLGAVGSWVHRSKRWLLAGVVAVALAVLVAWDYPTGWVVFWLAAVVLAGVTVVEFLDAAA